MECLLLAGRCTNNFVYGGKWWEFALISGESYEIVVKSGEKFQRAKLAEGNCIWADDQDCQEDSVPDSIEHSCKGGAQEKEFSEGAFWYSWNWPILLEISPQRDKLTKIQQKIQIHATFLPIHSKTNRISFHLFSPDFPGKRKLLV